MFSFSLSVANVLWSIIVISPFGTHPCPLTVSFSYLAKLPSGSIQLSPCSLCLSLWSWLWLEMQPSQLLFPDLRRQVGISRCPEVQPHFPSSLTPLLFRLCPHSLLIALLLISKRKWRTSPDSHQLIYLPASPGAHNWTSHSFTSDELFCFYVGPLVHLWTQPLLHHQEHCLTSAPSSFLIINFFFSTRSFLIIQQAVISPPEKDSLNPFCLPTCSHFSLLPFVAVFFKGIVYVFTLSILFFSLSFFTVVFDCRHAFKTTFVKIIL